MMRTHVIVALVGMMAAQAAPQTAQPNLSGDWSLVSATTTLTRAGGAGEQPTTQFVSDFSAFNCGRECRITYKGSTLTIENAKLEDGATTARPTVTIPVDGQSHSVVDSVTIGNTIETTSQWEDGKLLITSMVVGRPVLQRVFIENDQLVVVKVAAATRTLRYKRK